MPLESDHPDDQVRISPRYHDGSELDLQQWIDELESDSRYHAGDPLIAELKRQLQAMQSKEQGP